MVDGPLYLELVGTRVFEVPNVGIRSMTYVRGGSLHSCTKQGNMPMFPFSPNWGSNIFGL